MIIGYDQVKDFRVLDCKNRILVDVCEIKTMTILISGGGGGVEEHR